MTLEEYYKNAFFSGNKCWYTNDYINARYWFKVAMQHPDYYERALLKLIQIEIREGKYAVARQLLDNNKNFAEVEFKLVYGLLENIENNFEMSKKYYGQCMVEPNMQFKSLLTLAKLYVQTGDYMVAKKMYETLLLEEAFEVQSLFGFIGLGILEGDYEGALNILKTIDERKLNLKQVQYYRICNNYLLFMLGRLEGNRNSFDPVKDYMTYRLFDKSDRTLLNHMRKHMNRNERYSNGCFFKNVDFSKLLLEVRNKIETMNANHFQVSDMYRFRLDTPIGYKGDEVTSDLCVVTMIGTKDIITMYPVQLFDEFDREGFSYDKGIALKRKQGGIKR